jgi:hypothetical protein
MVVVPRGQSYHCAPTSPQASRALIAECLERLARENTHLLGTDEVPAILQTSARVQALRAENARLAATNAELGTEIARAGRAPAFGKMLAAHQALETQHDGDLSAGQ